MRVQRGYGIGSFLKGLFRSAVPLFKEGARTVGKTALNSGVNIARDLLAGQDLKSAVQSRAREAGNELRTKAKNAVRSAIGQTGKGIKRRAPTKKISQSQTKRRKNIYQENDNRNKTSDCKEKEEENDYC